MLSMLISMQTVLLVIIIILSHHHHHHQFCHAMCPCSDADIESDAYVTNNIRRISSSMIMCIAIRSSNVQQRTLMTDMITTLNSLPSPHSLEFSLVVLANATSIETMMMSVKCNVFVEVIDTDMTTEKTEGNDTFGSAQYLCPGQCSPFPFVSVPLQLFTSELPIEHFGITCSLTTSMVLSSLGRPQGDEKTTLTALQQWSKALLKGMFWRRLMECYERKLWINAYEHHNVQKSEDLHLMHHENTRFYRGTLNFSDAAVPHSSGRGRYHFTIAIERRKITSLVIWIGSSQNLDLIRQQSVTIGDQDVHGTDAVIGWAATDECFPCNSYDKCTGPGNFRYKYLPGSNMKFAKFGWACAQRRPLRALAHVLRIFDPDFAVILDDDTLLNYKLLVQRYILVISTNSSRPVVMGEFRGRQGDEGHLTKLGIMVGGSGYILNRRVLESLVSYNLHHFPLNRSNILTRNASLLHRPPQGPEDLESDEYRSNVQIHFLSVVSEGVQNSKQACSVFKNINTCTFFNRPLRMSKKTKTSAVSYPIAIPVIEFCANLMADEKTCQHSDHSLGRCLMYAVAADPIEAACHSLVEPWPDSIKIGMCFITPSCNLSSQITCHRYKPHGNETVRITLDKGHYQHYSSFFDGRKIDSH